MESNSSVEELLEKAREQGKIYLEEPFHQKDFHHYFNCQTWEEWVSVLNYCEGLISSTPARDWLLHSRSPEVAVNVVCLSELPRVQPRSQFQRDDAAFATTTTIICCACSTVAKCVSESLNVLTQHPYWACCAKFLSRVSQSLGNFSSIDGDGNKMGKKNNNNNKNEQTNNGFRLAKQTCVLDVSLPSLHFYNKDLSFMEVVNTKQKCSFSFCELRYSPLESIPESFPTLENLNEIWWEEWGLEQRVFNFE